METPSLNNSSSSSSDDDGEAISLQEGSELMWRCRVTAGVGDSLLWTLNDNAIPSIDASNLTKVCDRYHVTSIGVP